jgi:hypothetical protein
MQLCESIILVCSCALINLCVVLSGSAADSDSVEAWTPFEATLASLSPSSSDIGDCWSHELAGVGMDAPMTAQASPGGCLYVSGSVRRHLERLSSSSLEAGWSESPTSVCFTTMATFAESVAQVFIREADSGAASTVGSLSRSHFVASALLFTSMCDHVSASGCEPRSWTTSSKPGRMFAITSWHAVQGCLLSSISVRAHIGCYKLPDSAVPGSPVSVCHGVDYSVERVWTADGHGCSSGEDDVALLELLVTGNLPVGCLPLVQLSSTPMVYGDGTTSCKVLADQVYSEPTRGHETPGPLLPPCGAGCGSSGAWSDEAHARSSGASATKCERTAILLHYGDWPSSLSFVINSTVDTLAAHETRPGASGSPYFTKDGLLIGLHRSGSVEGARMVGCDSIRRLFDVRDASLLAALAGSDCECVPRYEFSNAEALQRRVAPALPVVYGAMTDYSKDRALAALDLPDADSDWSRHHVIPIAKLALLYAIVHPSKVGACSWEVEAAHALRLVLGVPEGYNSTVFKGKPVEVLQNTFDNSKVAEAWKLKVTPSLPLEKVNVTRKGLLSFSNFIRKSVVPAFASSSSLAEAESWTNVAHYFEEAAIAVGLSCALHEAFKPWSSLKSVTLRHVEWAPWNLFVGPSKAHRGGQDPGSNFEGVVPRSFSKDVHCALRCINDAIDKWWTAVKGSRHCGGESDKAFASEGFTMKSACLVLEYLESKGSSPTVTHTVTGGRRVFTADEVAACKSLQVAIRLPLQSELKEYLRFHLQSIRDLYACAGTNPSIVKFNPSDWIRLIDYPKAVFDDPKAVQPPAGKFAPWSAKPEPWKGPFLDGYGKPAPPPSQFIIANGEKDLPLIGATLNLKRDVALYYSDPTSGVLGEGTRLYRIKRIVKNGVTTSTSTPTYEFLIDGSTGRPTPASIPCRVLFKSESGTLRVMQQGFRKAKDQDILCEGVNVAELLSSCKC